MTLYCMYVCVVVWMISFGGIAFGVTVTFEPNKAALMDGVTITCKRLSGSSASITWESDSSPLTTCDGTVDDICIPSPTGYTVSTDVSANEFNLSLASTSIANCKTYTCTDATTTTDTASEKLYLSNFDETEISKVEPGANTDGSISITTGCVLPPSDLTITWSKIVNGKTVALSSDDPSPVTSTDRSSCTMTCHDEQDEKVTSTFTHTEYTGTDSVEGQYMVTVTHISYPNPFTWTTANSYKLKSASTPEPDCCFCMIRCTEIKKGLCIFLCIIIILVIAGSGIPPGMAIEAIFGIWGRLNQTWRIVSFFPFLFGLGLYLCDLIRQRCAANQPKGHAQPGTEEPLHERTNFN